jgi:hypothetical protein
MKKIILVSFLFLSIIAVNAQEEAPIKDVQKQNEIKLNGLYLVLGAFEGTYEHLLNEESGVGVSVFLPFDDDVNDDINYYISPYYRFYFGKKYAAGFFVEGFGMLNSYKDTNVVLNDLFDVVKVNDDNVTDFALGIGIGGKWVTNRGMFAEINFGVGRNLFNSSDYNDYEFVGKAAISIGFRF